MGTTRPSVEQCHDLMTAGVLGKEDKIELFDGYLVRKAHEPPVHAAVISMLFRWFIRKMPAGFTV